MGKKWRSIDLFAGIGGIRLGFDRAFGEENETVFVSEWDSYAQKTYAANFDLNFAHCLRPVFFKGQYPLSYAMVGVIPKNGRKGPLPRAQHPVWADSNSAMAIR